MESKTHLYIVATPIGNLQDMVPRAVAVLQSVDLVAAEDTRHSSKLMEHFNIGTPMVPYHDHGESQQLIRMLDALEAGKTIALISDAGTPLISDPGYRLVNAALEKGYKVSPIPGSCALIAALSVCGLPSNNFYFEGFLPAKTAARIERLKALKELGCTLVFYEAPHRILEMTRDLHEVFGGQIRASIARELTKQYETVKTARLTDLVNWVEADPNQQRGECVVVVEPVVKQLQVDAEVSQVLSVLLKHHSVKDASSIASEITGVRKKQLYQAALALLDQ